MSRNPVPVPRILFALVVAGATALGVGFFVRDFPSLFRTLLSIVSGLVGFIVGANILPSGKKLKDPDQSLLRLSAQAQRNQDELQASALELIRNQRTSLEKIAFRITDDQLRAPVSRILQVYQGMAESVNQDPKDSRPVRRFLNYYGEAGIHLLQHYLQLRNLPEDRKKEEVSKSVQGILESITELADAFQVQLTRLVDNDLMELDTELTVLKKTMALEGMTLPKE